MDRSGVLTTIGLAVLLMTLAERLVPDSQLGGGLERGIQTFLMASALDAANDPGAKQRFDEARDIARELPEPAATLLSLVNDRDVVRLGPLLLPEIASLSSSPSLSPERVEPPAAPVFLLHGTDDNVVPAAESTLLGKHLEQRGSRAARVLLSPLITHAEIERAPGPERRGNSSRSGRTCWFAVTKASPDRRRVDGIRLQKLMSAAGVASRRAAERPHSGGPRQREWSHGH